MKVGDIVKTHLWSGSISAKPDIILTCEIVDMGGYLAFRPQEERWKDCSWPAKEELIIYNPK